MKKTTIFILLIIGIITAVSLYLYFSTQTTNTNNKTELSKVNKVEVSSLSSAGSTNTSSLGSESQSSSKPEIVELESGYTDYDESKLKNAKYGKVILFFHAKWCPSCRALDDDIKNNLSKIPKDFLILKVDYDTSTSLKNKYKVTVQHTLVQVMENGDQIKSSQGLYQLTTLDSVLNNFK